MDDEPIHPNDPLSVEWDILYEGTINLTSRECIEARLRRYGLRECPSGWWDLGVK